MQKSYVKLLSYSTVAMSVVSARLRHDLAQIHENVWTRNSLYAYKIQACSFYVYVMQACSLYVYRIRDCSLYVYIIQDCSLYIYIIQDCSL